MLTNVVEILKEAIMIDKRIVKYNERNFYGKSLCNIPPNFRGKINIGRDVVLHGDYFVPCRLVCRKLTVKGNLTLFHGIKCDELDVTGTLTSFKNIVVKGDVCAQNLNAAGSITCSVLSVKKHLFAHNVTAQKLIVG